MDLSPLKYGKPSDSGFVRVDNTRELDPPELLTLLPGAVYSTKWKAWYVPANVRELTTPQEPWFPYREYKAPSGLKLARLQNEAVQRVESNWLGSIIALPTGLGKSAVALQYAHEHPELRPVLVLGPVSAAPIWTDPDGDAMKHYGLTTAWLRSKSADIGAFRGLHRTGFDLYYINYEILADWKTAINTTLKPRLVILDEADEVCNVRTKASRAAESICCQPSIAKRILLTATPVNNNVMELYGLLSKAQPRQWGTWVKFGIRYAGGYEDEYGWHMDDESNTAELTARLRSVLFRGSDVIKDWTTLHRDVVTIPEDRLVKSAMREYTFAKNEPNKLIALRGGSFQGLALQQYGLMARAVSRAKIPFAVEAIREFLFELPKQKCLVFTWFQETAEQLCAQLRVTKNGQAVAVLGPFKGNTTHRARTTMLDTFTDTKGPTVIVATLETAKRSSNRLVAAQGVFFVDLWYVPGTMLQAEGRINRRGQLEKDIYSRTLLAPNSMDMIMWGYLQRKARLIEKTGDAEASSLVEALGGRGKKETVQSLLEDLADLTDEDLELQ